MTLGKSNIGLWITRVALATPLVFAAYRWIDLWFRDLGTEGLASSYYAFLVCLGPAALFAFAAVLVLWPKSSRGPWLVCLGLSLALAAWWGYYMVTMEPLFFGLTMTVLLLYLILVGLSFSLLGGQLMKAGAVPGANH